MEEKGGFVSWGSAPDPRGASPLDPGGGSAPCPLFGGSAPGLPVGALAPDPQSGLGSDPGSRPARDTLSGLTPDPGSRPAPDPLSGLTPGTGSRTVCRCILRGFRVLRPQGGNYPSAAAFS
ncbi:hypothetical protein GCM10010388_54350 [Streptomyces mauvecolor]